MKVNELYWSAGFLEGEGTFGYYHTSPRVEAVQVQLEPLQRLQKIFGGNIKHQKARNERSQPQYIWNVFGPRAAGVMMTLYKLMSPKRKERIFKSLSEWKSRQFRNGWRAVA